MTKRFVLVVLLIALGCAGKHIQQGIDVYSDTMDGLNHAYQDTEKALIKLHDDGAITPALWRQISIKNVSVVDPAMAKLNNTWAFVGKNQTQIDLFLASTDFQSALADVLDLAKMAGLPDVIGKLTTMQAETAKVKK